MNIDTKGASELCEGERFRCFQLAHQAVELAYGHVLVGRVHEVQIDKQGWVSLTLRSVPDAYLDTLRTEYLEKANYSFFMRVSPRYPEYVELVMLRYGQLLMQEDLSE